MTLAPHPAAGADLCRGAPLPSERRGVVGKKMRQPSPVPKDQTPQRFGPFVLERRIAIGGTAEVFQARPAQGSRPAPELVIKRLLSQESHERDFQSLSREAELHRAVRHDNVVTVFGAGMVGTEPYLAMEYVAGVDLHRLLRLAVSESRPLPTAVAVYIACSIARALQAVHSACDEQGLALDLTHGDVSPSNIYLSRTGDVKLGDFGLAHTARGSSSARGESLKGKAGYLAPEQLQGMAIDGRADVFALAVVLGEMLIGEKIFPGKGQLAVSLSIREGNVEPLRRAEGRLPPELFRACTRALERDPRQRYPSAEAFAQHLEAFFDAKEARAQLVEWVSWAQDGNVFARQFEERLRHASGASWLGKPPELESGERPRAETTSVRRLGTIQYADLTFSALLELAATGHLRLDDEVSLMGEPFRKVETVDELSHYLMPSTTTTTAQLFEPGVPDFTAELSETSMLEVLGRMRQRRESGALFVARTDGQGVPDRKDIYLVKGRLFHVTSADREELLGQYAVRLKLINQEQLEQALLSLKSFGGKIADTLVGMGFAEPAAVARVARNQGRDRVAALCSWRDGQVQLYRGSEAGQVQFPLNLDLSIPMMTGAILMVRQRADVLEKFTRVLPGRRFEDTESDEERGDAPAPLVELLGMVGSGLRLADVLHELVKLGRARGRSLPEREARAAVMVALALEWVRAE